MASLHPEALSQLVKNLAAEEGFDRCGITRAEPIGRSDYLRTWLGAGRAGTMDYLHRHFDKRTDPRALLEGARGVIVLALVYNQPRPDPPLDNDKRGRVAMYAWGDDYHKIVKDKLFALVRRLRQNLLSLEASTGDVDGAARAPENPRGLEHSPSLRPEPRASARAVSSRSMGSEGRSTPHSKTENALEPAAHRTNTERVPEAQVQEPFDFKVCVDTAPVLERELAAAAGIGWIGKNTMVLDSRLGSHFFLGEIITTLDMACDEPVLDRCGTCTACLDACPTSAFPKPYEMDASRCISYLTIEHRDDISPDLATMMGDWLFGCDLCQDACPYNRRAPQTREPGFAIRSPGPHPRLDDILDWSADDYRTEVRGSAIKRAKLDMLKRNARIAGGNL